MSNIDIKPIRNEADYDAALRQIERYFEQEPDPGSSDAGRFDALTTLLGVYEQKQW